MKNRRNVALTLHSLVQRRKSVVGWLLAGQLLTQLACVLACKSPSHLMTGDMNACTSFCQEKVVGVEDKAMVTPQLYDFEGMQCCKCNYEKLNTAPDVGDTYDAYEVPSYGDGGAYEAPPAVPDVSQPEKNPEPSPPKEPAAPKTPALDPASFEPPSWKQLKQSVDSSYEPPMKPGETMNYAVIQVLGMPWKLPLTEQEIEAFVYAMSNVTGIAWQYKGAMVGLYIS